MQAHTVPHVSLHPCLYSCSPSPTPHPPPSYFSFPLLPQISSTNQYSQAWPLPSRNSWLPKEALTDSKGRLRVHPPHGWPFLDTAHSDNKPSADRAQARILLFYLLANRRLPQDASRLLRPLKTACATQGFSPSSFHSRAAPLPSTGCPRPFQALEMCFSRLQITYTKQCFSSSSLNSRAAPLPSTGCPQPQAGWRRRRRTAPPACGR